MGERQRGSRINTFAQRAALIAGIALRGAGGVVDEIPTVVSEAITAYTASPIDDFAISVRPEGDGDAAMPNSLIAEHQAAHTRSHPAQAEQRASHYPDRTRVPKPRNSPVGIGHPYRRN